MIGGGIQCGLAVILLRKKKICKECGKESYIFSHHLCVICANKNKRINPIAQCRVWIRNWIRGYMNNPEKYVKELGYLSEDR